MSKHIIIILLSVSILLGLATLVGPMAHASPVTYTFDADLQGWSSWYYWSGTTGTGSLAWDSTQGHDSLGSARLGYVDTGDGYTTTNYQTYTLEVGDNISQVTFWARGNKPNAYLLMVSDSNGSWTDQIGNNHTPMGDGSWHQYTYTSTPHQVGQLLIQFQTLPATGDWGSDLWLDDVTIGQQPGGQYRVNGTVRDASNGAPIPGVNITTTLGGQQLDQTTSNQTGQYTITAAPGNTTIYYDGGAQGYTYQQLYATAPDQYQPDGTGNYTYTLDAELQGLTQPSNIYLRYADNLTMAKNGYIYVYDQTLRYTSRASTGSTGSTTINLTTYHQYTITGNLTGYDNKSATTNGNGQHDIYLDLTTGTGLPGPVTTNPGTSTNNNFSLTLAAFSTGSPYVDAVITAPTTGFDRIVWTADGYTDINDIVFTPGTTEAQWDYTYNRWQRLTGSYTDWQPVTRDTALSDDFYFGSPGTHTVTATIYNQGATVALLTGSISIYATGSTSINTVQLIDSTYNSVMDGPANVTIIDQTDGLTKTLSWTGAAEANMGNVELARGHQIRITASKTGYLNTTKTVVWPSTSSGTIPVIMTSTGDQWLSQDETYLDLYLQDPQGNPISNQWVQLLGSTDGSHNLLITDQYGNIHATVTKNMSYTYVAAQGSTTWTSRSGTVQIGTGPLNVHITLYQQTAQPTPTTRIGPTAGPTPGPTARSTMGPTAAPGQPWTQAQRDDAVQGGLDMIFGYFQLIVSLGLAAIVMSIISKMRPPRRR